MERTREIAIDNKSAFGEVTDAAATMDLMADLEEESETAPFADVQDVALNTRHTPPSVSPIRNGQPLFTGVPVFTGGEAVLFDTARQEDSAKLPHDATFTRLDVHFPTGKPEQGVLHHELFLLLFVDDLAQPRARVRLADLFRQGGTRPLNVQRVSGQVVRIVLADSSGNASKLPPVEVALNWRL